MSTHDVTIHEDAAQRIQEVLRHFLGESSAADALLIDRSGQFLVGAGNVRSLDTVSLSALAPRPVKKIDGRPQQKSKSGEIKENEKIEI